MRSRFVSVLVAAFVAVTTAVGAQAASTEAIPVKTQPPPVDEITPAADGRWFVWARDTADSPYGFVVLAQRGSEPRIRVNPRGTYARGGGVDGRTVVYTLDWVDDDSDVYRFDLRTRTRSRFPSAVNTPASEYAPSVSGRWLLFGRMTYPRSRVLLFDRRAGTVRVVARRQYELWPGQVNGDYATWEGERQFRYHIPTATTQRLPLPDGAVQRSPAVSSDGTAYVCRRTADAVSDVIVRFRIGKPGRSFHTLPTGRACLDLFVKDRADGARVVFFVSIPEQSGGIEGADIYKVVDR